MTEYTEDGFPLPKVTTVKGPGAHGTGLSASVGLAQLEARYREVKVGDEAALVLSQLEARSARHGTPHFTYLRDVPGDGKLPAQLVFRRKS